MKKIEITRENYKDYIKLYKNKKAIDEKANKISRLLNFGGTIPILLSLIVAALSLHGVLINNDLRYIFIFFMGIGNLAILNSDMIKKHYKRKKNERLKEEFPNMAIEIETSKLEIALANANIITIEPVYGKIFNYRYIREYQTNIDEKVFLKHLEETKEEESSNENKEEMTQVLEETSPCEVKYISEFVRDKELNLDNINRLMQAIYAPKKAKETLEKIKAIIKCEEIKNQILEEYQRDYSRLKYETSVSQDELERVKTKQFTKSKHLS